MASKSIENTFPPDSDVLVELEKVDDPLQAPFLKGKVVKVILPGAQAKVKQIFIEVKLEDSKVEKFRVELVQRTAQKEDIYVNDMAELSPINTHDLLNNIKNRYDKNEIFTLVGETLIIVNPYYIIPGIYTEEKMQEIITFCDKNIEDGCSKYIKSSPHVFDTAMNTIFDLIFSRKDQALVISGESGAGKTECAKLCMKFIAYYLGNRGQSKTNEVSLEDKILACNPVLEAFGNSKTVRNDNSSRFGKYIKIFVNLETRKIVGAFMETYLLEKSRVVHISQGERNYHIFYQVILGLNLIIKENFNYDKIFETVEGMRFKLADNTKKYFVENLTKERVLDYLNLKDCVEIKLETLTYLKNDVYTVPKINDVRDFFECVQGMVHTNFTPEEINNVIKIVITILHIGNIEFEEEASKDKCCVKKKSKELQNKICDLLNIDKKIFESVFLYNVRIIKGETINTALKLSDCLSYRDTFAKEIYNRLFGYLVERMNLTLFDESKKTEIETSPDIKHIGLLDIFGFECFKENSFEQFCINYANEKLQNLYVIDIFKEIENMFIREGLKDHFKKIEFKDNTIILDAMGKKPTGIFYILDNECNMTQKDMNLLGTIFSTLKNNPHIKSSLKFKERFTLIHTAKDVDYNIMGFCMKNLDEFKLRMKDSILSIKDELLTKMIGEEDEAKAKKKEKYLGGKFRNDMDNLANALGQCVRHYIRCLKPNEVKKQHYFVSHFSLQQIKYMGILDTIRIRQEGFPIVKTYHEFYLRYEDAVDFKGKLFYKNVKDDNPNLKAWCDLILKTLLPNYNADLILFGKTVILMKQVMCDDLDEERKKQLVKKEEAVSRITNKYRGLVPFREFNAFYQGIYTLQQSFKLFEHINKIKKIKQICGILQTKSKINSVKEESKMFMENVKKIKKFVSSNIMKYRLKKAYIKALQTKYVMTNYVSQFKHQKYLKYKKNVLLLLQKRINNYIESTYIPSALMIQPIFRGYLTRRNMGDVYTRIVKRRGMLKEEIQCKKIQKYFLKHFYMNSVLVKQKAADKFVALIRYHKFHQWYTKTRGSVVIIQRAYKRRYLMRYLINSRLKEFTEEEDNLFEESNAVAASTLFPNQQIDNELNTNGSQGNLQKKNKINEKKAKKLDATTLSEYSYLHNSQFDDPKLNFFAHILDLDTIINLDDIYEQPWAETLQEIIKHNINQNTPIQLIEIGEMFTTLVNTNGKAFTWGWNGNGQCAFNINKDNKFQYEDIKEYVKRQNYKETNTVREDIKNYCIKNSLLDKNFDFEYEINNIREERELFDNENEEESVFNKNDFLNFYYLNNPMIIDNFNLKKIKCSDDFTMVITNDDKLYVFGANNNYQLGILKNRNIFSPILFQNIFKLQSEKTKINLKSDFIDMQVCGKHCLLLNQDGALILLSCHTADNQLIRSPIEIPLPNIKFSNIECGKDFCLLLTNNGLLYSFGDNKYGQLGHGDFNNRNYPTLVNYFFDKSIKVQQISCGYKHCSIRGNNKGYSWGCNSYGQIGTGNFKHMSLPFLNDIKYSKMGNNLYMVSCGLRMTAFLTESRQIFWCGTCGDLSQQDTPIEFNYAQKLPELFGYDIHTIIKINHTWSKTCSIFYATVAETAPLQMKLNNPNKMQKLLSNLTNKWLTKDLYPPKIEGMENFIGTKHIMKGVSKIVVDNKKKK